MSPAPATYTNHIPNPTFTINTTLVDHGDGTTIAAASSALHLTGTTPALPEDDNWAGEVAYVNAQPGTEVTFKAVATGDDGLYARLALHWRAGSTIIFDTYGERVALGATPTPLTHTSPAPSGADNVEARIYVSGSSAGAPPPSAWAATTDLWIATREGTADIGVTLAGIDTVWAGATLDDYDAHWAGATLAAIDINPLDRS